MARCHLRHSHDDWEDGHRSMARSFLTTFSNYSDLHPWETIILGSCLVCLS